MRAMRLGEGSRVISIEKTDSETEEDNGDAAGEDMAEQSHKENNPCTAGKEQ